MNRRDFVTASVVGVGIGAAGGCLSSMRGSIPVRRITGVEAEASSSDVDVRGEVLQPTISADEQGSVRLRFTWSGGETRLLGFGSDGPVNDPTLESTPDGLVLTRDTAPEMRQDDETWVLEEVPWGTLEYNQHELEPSEEVTGEYYLWGDPDHVNYIRATDYVVGNSICPAGAVGDPCDSFETTYTIEIRDAE